MVSSASQTASAQHRPVGPAIFAALILLAIIFTALIVNQHGHVAQGRMADPDCYMRLERVLQIWRGGDWYDPVYAQINPPEGHASHWTRPLDVLLLVPSAVLSLVMPFETALFWVAALIAPLTFLALVPLTVWAFKPVLGAQWRWVLPFLLVSQPLVLGSFMPARPDNPFLALALFIVFSGGVLRLLQRDPPRFAALVTGLSAGLAIWHTLETTLFVVPGFAVLALCWILGGASVLPMARAAGWALLATLFGLAVEQGPETFSRLEYDQLSWVHGLLMAVNAGTFAVLAAAQTRMTTWLRRFGAAAVCAVVGGGLAVALAPGLLSDPVGNIDPFYEQTRLAFISEYRPLFDPAKGVVRGLIAWPVSVLMIVLLGMVGGVLAWRRGAGNLAGWLYIAVLSAVYLFMSLGALHWAGYLQLAVLTPAAIAVAAATERAARNLFTLARPLLVFLACGVPFMPLVLAGGDTEGPADAKQACLNEHVHKTLSNQPPGLLMAFVDFGPELLYRTPHSILSMPNHRPQPGYTLTYQVMAQMSARQAEAALRQRDVDYVLVCEDLPVARKFYAQQAGADPLYPKLAAGEAPAFLTLVPLDRAQTTARLYRLAQP